MGRNERIDMAMLIARNASPDGTVRFFILEDGWRYDPLTSGNTMARVYTEGESSFLVCVQSGTDRVAYGSEAASMCGGGNIPLRPFYNGPCRHTDHATIGNILSEMGRGANTRLAACVDGTMLYFEL